MERERSLSSSSSDSWSLLEEIEDENENEQSNEEKHDLMPPLPSDPNVCPAQIGQMDPLESISSVQLPLDLSTALLASSQHLLVVTTPASSSIVTHSGAILSPEQSAQALASDPNSPVLVSPPKSPPIESTFTFLKDPKLRISFSDSCESKEEEGDEGRNKREEDEEEKGIVANTGNGENCTADEEEEEVFEQSPTPNESHLPIEVENLAKEITEMVEIEMEKAEQELGREKVVMKNLESAKMSTKEIEAKIGGEEEESSESESILCGGQNSAESISSSRIAEYSSTNSNGSEENSTQLDSESEMEEEEKGREELMGNAENEEGEIESSTISSLPSSMLSSTSASISPISMAEEEETPSILPPLPDSLPSSLENHSERLEMNDSSRLEGSGEFVEGGWTELSISSLSAYSSDEANNLGANSVAESGDGKGNEGQTVGGMDAAEMVARRFDELSEQMDESFWQRFLDETFGSLKNFERSDRIINILIIAMFLTSISSMTILHILENSWIGSNISNSMQSSPPLLQSPLQPAATEFRADSRQVDDKWNSELRQCKDELIEAKHAYESKAKLLHYVRFKEMEQEALVEELRKELETAKFALDNLQQKQQLLGGKIPIFHLDDSTENEGKMGEMDLKGTMERRIRKRRAMRNAVERATKGPNVEEAIRPEEYAGEQSGMPTKPTALLAPMIWPGIMEIGGGRLIGPPAELDSQLVPPPVPKNQKRFEDKAIDVQEDLNAYWPSQFMPITFDDPKPSTSEDFDQNAKDENEPECSEPKRTKIEEEDEEEGTEEENVFGAKMFTNWRKYNEILQNLSTQSGRTHMLRRVRNAVVARLNRTIEKTTTALAAATKLVTSENFGPNLLSSTVKEVMARMENSGLSHIVDCLNNGIQRIQNIQLCIPQFVDWPIGEEEEENEELEDEGKMDEKEDENDENDEQYCSSQNKMEEEEMERNDAKNEENEEPAAVADDDDDSSEGRALSSGSGVWLLQRATARAALRHQSMDQGSGLIFANRTRFSRWLFARAALRQKQRKEQRNGTTESETRSSLFRDDWMFARQKIRAKLRGKHRQNGEEAKENWFFVRQKMREKAREEGRGEEENEEKELENEENGNNWLFGRQKLRKMREEEERNLWPSDSEEEGPKKKRKWWRKKQQKKKWKKGWKIGNEGKWRKTQFEEGEYYGESSQFSGDEEEE